MKRIFTIARAHGARGLVSRACAYAGLVLGRYGRAVAAAVTQRQAMRLPRRRETIAFTAAAHPAISVLVTGGNDWRYVNRCLRALRRLQTESPLEIFVSCDAAIEPQLRAHRGMCVLVSSPGATFGGVLKDAASRASGRNVYAIDSRAVPAAGAISRLAATLDRDAGVAAATSQIRSHSGFLREAGRRISGDGKIVAEGAGASSSDSRFAYLRDVESVSPASFMAKIDPLREALTRASAFHSAPYAVADLSHELRSLGLRCVYQPFSVVTFDAGEPDTDEFGEAQTFAAKWRQARPDASASSPGLLVVEEHVPFDDRDAGSRRIAALMSFARGAKWNVAFGSIDANSYPPYGDRLRDAGVELLLGFRTRTVAQLTAQGRRFDFVWLSRASVAGRFADAVRSLQPGARIVYDTVDLHHLRLERQETALSKRTGWAEIERAEMESARKSDLVVVTSEAEKALLEERGLVNVAVVGLAEPAAPRSLDYRDTEGVLFVGNYAHEPNVDAALSLAQEIMPLVWLRIPEAVLTLAGADPTAAVKRLAGPRIRVPGFVRSLDPLLGRARVFAAPLRFGAGLKGKIVLALSAGIPVVTTAVGAEGIVQTPDDLAVAGDARDFAAAIVRVYSDEAEWRRFSSGASRAALRFSPQALARSFGAVLEKTI